MADIGFPTPLVLSRESKNEGQIAHINKKSTKSTHSKSKNQKKSLKTSSPILRTQKTSESSSGVILRVSICNLAIKFKFLFAMKLIFAKICKNGGFRANGKKEGCVKKTIFFHKKPILSL